MKHDEGWGRVWWLMRDPHASVPSFQWMDQQEHDGGVIEMGPFNRPAWPSKPFHCRPLIRAFRLFRLMRRDHVPWQDLLILYERFKKQQYG